MEQPGRQGDGAPEVTSTFWSGPHKCKGGGGGVQGLMRSWETWGELSQRGCWPRSPRLSQQQGVCGSPLPHRAGAMAPNLNFEMKRTCPLQQIAVHE